MTTSPVTVLVVDDHAAFRVAAASVLARADGFVLAGEPNKAPKHEAKSKPAIVPYHLTDTQHVLVRIKLNGKGPFNFVVDTGCPVLVINTAVAKKAGLEDNKGLTTVDKLEFEGGLVQTKVKARVEPELLDPQDPLAGMVGLNNALYLTTDLLGEVGIVQRGGSLTQTAYALLSDVSRIAQEQKEI